MNIKVKWYSCLVAIGIMQCSIVMLYAFTQKPETLEWSVLAEKDSYYPGESVLLKLNVQNNDIHEKRIIYGGIDAFSIKIYDSNEDVLCTGKKITREGISFRGIITVSAGESSQESFILNQWCSTSLLPIGTYRVVCSIDYLLHSEMKASFDTRGLIAGPRYRETLSLDIEIVEMNLKKFEEVLESLIAYETQPEALGKRDWLEKREIAREMIAFTESELAVAYQLKILPVAQSTWTRRDIIHSLTHSASSQAAKGLVEFYENPKFGKLDIKNDVIEAVYKMRAFNDAEILSLTEDFVTKHKRPPMPTGRKLNGN